LPATNQQFQSPHEQLFTQTTKRTPDLVGLLALREGYSHVGAFAWNLTVRYRVLPFVRPVIALRGGGRIHIFVPKQVAMHQPVVAI